MTLSLILQEEGALVRWAVGQVGASTHEEPYTAFVWKRASGLAWEDLEFARGKVKN